MKDIVDDTAVRIIAQLHRCCNDGMRFSEAESLKANERVREFGDR